MKQITLLCFIILSFLSISQKNYFLKDKITEEPVPFAKIYPQNESPFLADIDGFFSLNQNSTNVEVKVAGFKDTIIVLADVKDSIIYLTPIFQNIQEVRVIAGENPAHRIIDQVISNRKKNHPMENDAFTYETYSKFMFDIDREYLASIPDTTADSTLIKIKDFFDEQHLFLLESASKRSFIPPARDKEVITAYKVSGFSDPMFSTFASEMQSFSFYENQVQLLGVNYINPIAFGGTNRYLFILEDTTVVGLDTTFTIFYRPRKGKNFEGLTGRLFINTKGYAIEKVIAEPFDTTGMRAKIVQEYAFVENKKWFPFKLSTEIQMPLNISVEGFKILGKGSTYIREVSFDKGKIEKGSFDNVSVVVDEEAGEKKDADWENVREYGITDREKRTYVMVDSISKELEFNRLAAAMKVLAEGKIPLGYFNFDLYRLVNFNLYEGYRFGAGLETSRKLMKPISIGGYFGWATKDKDWKYGAYTNIHLYKKKGLKLTMKYQQDLIERGTSGFQRGSFDLGGTEMYRDFFQFNMDKQRLAEATLSMYVKGNIKLSVSGNYQRVDFTNNYRFFSVDGFTPSVASTEISEISSELTWNIRERIMLVGEQRISKGTVYPKIKIRAAKGLSGIYNSSFDYYRFNIELTQSFPILAAGRFNWSLTAGQTIGDVPLFLQQMANATGKAWNISVKNSFETMNPGEFYNSKQVGLFTRMDFTSIKTKAKWNEPQICLHHAIGYGEMPEKKYHSTDFRSMDKGYYEGGLILNGVITSGVTSLGIGGFYRYGYYSNSDWKKNIVPKISIAFNL